MEEYVKRIRETYRKELNVIEVNDLPLVLLTEVINHDVQPAPDNIKEKHFNRKHGANAYYGQIKKK